MLVVLPFRGYRSRDYFPTRCREVSATLKGVTFQRTEIIIFQTIWVVADINHTEHQLAIIFIGLFYCYIILSFIKVYLHFGSYFRNNRRQSNEQQDDATDTLPHVFWPTIREYRDR
jgi:hypothetical protein